MDEISFRNLLIRWYANHRRELPWRDIQDPYRIWISEIILQQTRIAQGYNYYLRFLEKFPTIQALAAAQEDEVLKVWEGLGYYSRARNMHAAAQSVAEEGSFPTTYDGVRKLKGVGDYTAAAICSFAYGMSVATVDGNVFRVLSRIFGIDTPIDTSEGKKVFTQLANSLLDTKNPADFNQALMDFGAIQCTPTNPTCQDCPFLSHCVAERTEMIDKLPFKLHKMQQKYRYFSYFFINYRGQILIHRRNERDIWKGLYEPYVIESKQAGSFDLTQHTWLNNMLAQENGTLKPLMVQKKHVLTHRIILADFYAVHISGQIELDLETLPNDYFFVPLENVDKYAYPVLIDFNLN